MKTIEFHYRFLLKTLIKQIVIVIVEILIKYTFLYQLCFNKPLSYIGNLLQISNFYKHLNLSVS